MGIPRLTQDLQPYLEGAVIARGTTNNASTLLHTLVIDGPSMVYHVYNRLASHKYTSTGSIPSLCSLPSYAELTTGVLSFLSVIENCGAKIEHIFFDGALPVSKRPIRLDRLEKSRQQLEAHKQTYPILRLQHDAVLQSSEDCSAALWQAKNTSAGLITNIASPFIVPAVVDCLSQSRWASKVAIVPGEAETFCAPAARSAKAVVLTNDSDMLLFEDLASSGIVVLLNTLKMSSPAAKVIEARCWQPSAIARKLNIKSLVSLGYERLRDPSTTLAAILQRATGLDGVITNDPAYQDFVDQYSSPGTNDNIFPSLSRLDPRLAELVCQLREHGTPDTSPKPHQLYVTLPMLHEDPNRDASWSYGRNLRFQAYEMLFGHYHKGRDIVPTNSVSDLPATTPQFSLLEYSRKGQRIAEDRMALPADSQQMIEAEQQLLHLNEQVRAVSSTLSLNPLPASFILWALHSVIARRQTTGKPVTKTLVEQLIGVAPLPTQAVQGMPSQIAARDEVNGWALLHLNANVQAMLYSLRMLNQARDLITHEQELEAVKSKIYAKSHISEDSLQVLDRMPQIQDLFLDPIRTRNLLQHIEKQQFNEMVQSIYETAGWVPPDKVAADATDEGVESTNKRCKKRRKPKTEPQHANSIAPLATARSSNPYDLLLRKGL